MLYQEGLNEVEALTLFMYVIPFRITETLAEVDAATACTSLVRESTTSDGAGEQRTDSAKKRKKRDENTVVGVSMGEYLYRYIQKPTSPGLYVFSRHAA